MNSSSHALLISLFKLKICTFAENKTAMSENRKLANAELTSLDVEEFIDI